MTKKEFAKTLAAGWPGPFVARSETRAFTGGALSGRTVANEESKGNVVPGRITIGKRIAYPTMNYAKWIANRMLKHADA